MTWLQILLGAATIGIFYGITESIFGYFFSSWGGGKRKTWLLKFTRELERQLPPAPGRHHFLRFSQFGSDQTGWDDRLCLVIVVPSGVERFFLSDRDLRGKPEVAAENIAAYISSTLAEKK